MKFNVFNIKNHKLIPNWICVCLMLTISANLFAHEGALPGAFSISATEKINFSKGNLQYQASTHTWRFADQQYNIIGSSGNSKASSTYDGWIDWFAWGTSGWNSGATYYQPWEMQPTWEGDDFNPGGSTTSDLTGTYQNADWGVYNSISNGGNTAGQWRTLSKDECYYLFNNRANAGNLYFFATVGGIRGLVILPDNWNSTSLSFFKNKDEYYGDNAISATDWINWEKSGAVFLPSSEVSTSSGYVSTCDGKYWTSTHCTDAYSSNEATTLNFRNYSLNDYIYKVFANECTYRSQRIYVRLVQSASNNNHTLLFNNNYPESNRTNLYVGREYFSPDINVLYDPVSCFTSINGTQKKDVECTPFELIGINAGDKISIRVYNYSGSRSHTIPECGVIDIVNKEGNIPTPRQWLDFITSEKDSLSNISISDSYQYLKLWLYNGGNEVVFSDYNFLVQVEKGETLSAVPSPAGHIITYGTTYGTLPQPPYRKGYTFEGWYTDSVSGTQITSSTIVTTTSDQILYAHWKRIQNTILASGTNGIISGAGTYFYGDTATLVATPNDGYHFTQWSDGNTDNPRQVVVTQDSIFQVEFMQLDTITISYDCSENGMLFDTITHGTNRGHEWVDLGLPSGLKWATCNVGADNYTEYGYYYPWSESAYWGGNWRLPTQSEWNELKSLYEWNWMQPGYLVKGNNENTIFLPAGGYHSHYNGDWYSIGTEGHYWASGRYSGVDYLAYSFNFSSSNKGVGSNYTTSGFSVRLVLDSIGKKVVYLKLGIENCSNLNELRCYQNTRVYIMAKEDEYHKFVQWSDGNTDNPRLVEVTQDSTFTAVFQQQLIIDVSVYDECKMNGYTKDLTNIAIVNSNSGRTSCEWVQLWKNGPKWATFNVGATITDYAHLIKGADFTPFYNAFNQMQYCNTSNVGGLYAYNNPYLNGRMTTWSSGVSTGTSDVATTLWGSNWKTPNERQLDTLQNSTYGKTTWTWCDGSTTQYVAGCTLKGFKVSGKGKYSENSIFLPVAGYFHADNKAIVDPGNGGHYWSDTQYNTDYIYYLSFRSLDDGVVGGIVYSSPWYGLSVRAVLATSAVATEHVTLTLKANDCETSNAITCVKDQSLRIIATNSECSKFVKWSDNDTSNPRLLAVGQDTTLTAIFEKIQFNITLETEDEKKGEVDSLP